MNKRAFIAWFISICVMALALPQIFKHEGPRLSLPKLKVRSDARIKDLFYRKIKRDKTVMELWAKDATFFKKGQIIEARSPRLILFSNKGLSQTGEATQKDRRVRVRALSGLLHLETMETIFRENVVLKTPDNTTLYTEELRFDPESHLLKSDLPVIIKKGGLEITGQSFAFNVETGRLTIKGSTTNILE